MKHFTFLFSLHEPEFFRLFAGEKTQIHLLSFLTIPSLTISWVLPAQMEGLGNTQSRSDGKQTEHIFQMLRDHFPYAHPVGLLFSRVNMHHTHTIVGNSAPVPRRHQAFSRDLQKNGYQTSFFGQVHMGDEDGQATGWFDYWLSFEGQELYKRSYF